MRPENREGGGLYCGAGLRELLERFSYDGYRRLLDRLRRDHVFGGFADDMPADGCFVLLRHDVDLSLEAAVQMAELEESDGVRSTYFVLFSSPFYNPLEPGAERALRSIVRAGHEVGLHYDAGLMETQAASGNAEEIAKVQAALLSSVTGTEVRCVAMHNPSLFSGSDPLAGGTAFINAYAKCLHNDVAYHSDSCGAWRTASIDALTGAVLPRRLQLLTHPELWSPGGGSRWDRLEAHIARRRQALSEAVAYTKQVYNEHAGVKEHDARRRNRT